jgi:GMP synthase (glutamine-hydrolysing)
MTTPRILILDNALDHGIYRPVEHWARLLGFTPDHVDVPSGEILPEPDRTTHVILSGSEASITARAPWAEDELRWVQRAAAHGVHLLGSCWGHQLIAAALGGARCVRSSATPEFGWRFITASDPGGLSLPASFHAFCSHFDEVVAGSHPDLRVLASSSACAVHAFRWGDLPVWGIQAHPEIDPDTGRSFLSLAAERFPAHRSLFEQALAGPVQDSDAGPELIKAFLAN